MNLIVILTILMVACGGGGFYFGGTRLGIGGFDFFLLVLLILFSTGVLGRKAPTATSP